MSRHPAPGTAGRTLFGFIANRSAATPTVA